MKIENLSTLKIHQLTKEQYDSILASGNIDENALYLTPDELDDIDLEGYVTVEQLEDYATNERVDTTNGRIDLVSQQVTSLNADISEFKNNYITTIEQAVPNTRKINGKALDADINLAAENVGADPAGAASEALEEAKAYTDSEINKVNLVIDDIEQVLPNTKRLQTEVQDPSVSSDKQVIAFIDTISQSANGNISVTKRNIKTASTSEAGIVKLSGNTEDLSNTSDAATIGSVASVRDIAEAVDTKLTAHISDKNNPHGVTAAQVGAPTTAEMNEALQYVSDLAAENAAAAMEQASIAQNEASTKVPNTRTVNGKALSSNITLSATDVGAPTVAEMNAAIGAIPTPDVSGQIEVHNGKDDAHSDIRTLITNITNGTTTVSKATNATNIYSNASTDKAYILGTTTASNDNHATVYNASVYTSGNVLYGACWNDYAEFRISDCREPGRVICENGDDTLSLATERLQPAGNVISDTFGYAIGETEEAKTPIAVSGRVLVYTYEDRDSYAPGDAVCAAPNGTVSKMTREEIMTYPERIVGTVSAIPSYETWGEENVPVNGRIWIKVR